MKTNAKSSKPRVGVRVDAGPSRTAERALRQENAMASRLRSSRGRDRLDAVGGSSPEQAERKR